MLASALLALAFLQAPAARPVTTPEGALDLWNLAKPHDCIERQASSFDRTGGNDDGFSGRFATVDPKTSETILLDAAGPGCVHRIWSANPQQDTTLEFFLDGESAPRFSCPFPALFDGSRPPLVKPFAERASGGSISYLPIPFAKSIRIVAKGPVYFFQVDWGRYPDGTAIASFDPAHVDVTARAPTPPSAPAPLPCMKSFITANGRPIQTLVAVTFPLDLGNGNGIAAEVKGPGAVTTLRATIASDDPAVARRMLLRVFCDGAKDPCVEAPLADFCGGGYAGAAITSLAFEQSGGSFVSRFVMPFAESLRAELIDFDPDHRVRADLALDGVACDVAEFGGLRFHARWRRALTKRGAFHEILKTEGRGHFVGCALTMSSPRQIFFLEGDEQALVDGRAPDEWTGTGTEDYFNCGWYFNEGTLSRNWHGLSHKDEANGEISAFRLHVADAIPFTKSFEFRIEHGGQNDQPGVEYASIAWWYATLDSTHDFERVDGTKLSPPRRMLGMPENALALDRLRIEPELPRETLSDLTPDFGGPEYASLDAAHRSATIRFPIEIADRMNLRLVAGKSAGGVRIIARVDDGAPTPIAIDGDALWLTTTTVGAFGLAHGEHRLQIELDPATNDGGATLRIAGLVLEPVLPFVADWQVFRTFTLEDGSPFDENQGPQSAEQDGWSRAHAEPNGYLDLAKVCDPADHALTYARFFVTSPDERRVTLRLGSDDWLALWVDRQEYLRKRVHRAAQPDQEIVEVPLKPGRNEILLKIANVDGAFGAFARVSDPKDGLVIGE